VRLRAGRKRSPKRLWLSFDEWNVWYRARGGRFANGEGKFAPRLLEEEYNLEDALLVGGFLNTLLRQAERVRLACLAQIVNVIAPLVTNETACCARASTTRTRGRSSTRAARARARPRVRELPDQGRGLRPDFARDGRCRSSTSPRPSTRRAARSAC
jgi:alpha-N-arabinofuranosidase